MVEGYTRTNFTKYIENISTESKQKQYVDRL